jgi:hypothetical protein
MVEIVKVVDCFVIYYDVKFRRWGFVISSQHEFVDGVMDKFIPCIAFQLVNLRPKILNGSQMRQVCQT